MMNLRCKDAVLAEAKGTTPAKIRAKDTAEDKDKAARHAHENKGVSFFNLPADIHGIVLSKLTREDGHRFSRVCKHAGALLDKPNMKFWQSFGCNDRKHSLDKLAHQAAIKDLLIKPSNDFREGITIFLYGNALLKKNVYDFNDKRITYNNRAQVYTKDLALNLVHLGENDHITHKGSYFVCRFPVIVFFPTDQDNLVELYQHVIEPLQEENRSLDTVIVVAQPDGVRFDTSQLKDVDGVFDLTPGNCNNEKFGEFIVATLKKGCWC